MSVYIEAKERWRGRVTTYINPGSYPVTRTVRIVASGHMDCDRPAFIVESLGPDALNADSWSEVFDLKIIAQAFAQYIK